ncbi:MAG: hypothetical protein Q7U84_07785 [Polynucleobacter sp.]|nr:hypothetical protein [Polynucleobacter sp.]
MRSSCRLWVSAQQILGSAPIVAGKYCACFEFRCDDRFVAASLG